MEKRLWLLLAIFAIFLMVSFVNLFFFPLTERTNWFISIPPQRGSIMDIRGRKMAYDSPEYVAYLDVDFFKRQNGNIKALEKTLQNCGITEPVEKVMEYKFFKLTEGEDRVDVLKKIESELLPFVNIELVYTRKKIQDYATGVLLGTVIDGRGKGGIEGFFDDQLRGKRKGFLELRYRGTRLSPSLVNYSPPENGKDVWLSLDLDLQRRVYDIISKAVEEYSAEAGHVIVMESKTGRILSMVTTRNWNDLIGGYIEPGSTIKPLVYAIALETHSASPDFTVECEGSIKPVEQLPVVIRDIEKHGLVDFSMGIVKSCNVMSVKVGELIMEKIGVDGFYEWLQKVGFGEKTGIEMEGEIAGVLREAKKWSLIDPAEISIGQGIGVTPVQLISSLNIFANDGYWVKPTILKDSQVEKRRVFSKETTDVIRQAMAQVVKEGTGKLAQVKEVSIAGKTGTAQKAIGGEYRNIYHSLFVGFFPAEDPKYTILVHLDSPSGAFYGGEVAAPVFREIVEIFTKKEDGRIEAVEGLMPDLTGLPVRDALLVLESLGVKDVEIKGKGWKVSEQTPPPNHPFEGPVILFLSDQK
ncbi:penicillin-binding protein 2 [Thermotoga sp. Mc24]|nr:penicillin-binding protein 2 [Thermotoga sp. Mc24]